MRIGERIKELREAKGWTQLELAQKMGINNSVLSRIEANKRPVEDILMTGFADLFEVDADYLLGRIPSGGRAFFGGAHSYTEEEQRVAEAAVEAYRKMKGLGK
jgi:transcriptional regulator with XRE-family HTH domain